MRASRNALIGTAFAFAAVLPGAATACTIVPPPPPPSGMSNADYQKQLIVEGQAGRWNRATTVVLARVVRLLPYRFDRRIDTTQARVRPVGLLKGPAVTKDFTVKPVGMGMCGGGGGDDLATDRQGRVFVVFLQAGKPGNDTMIGAIPVDNVVAPVIRAAIDDRR